MKVTLNGINEKMRHLLTNSQIRVYDLIVQGFSNDEIAIKLNIAEKTVMFHKTSIYKTMNCNKPEKMIVAYWMKRVEDIKKKIEEIKWIDANSLES